MPGSAGDRMIRSIRVAACSPEIRVGELRTNLRRAAEAITAAAADGARLIVLPELATSGYVFENREEARSVAMERGDDRWRIIQDALPENTVAVVGYCEDGGADLFNTAAVLTRSGRVGDYRKSHLWGLERTIFTGGDTGGAIVDTAVGRLGVAICYDNEFPEVPRKLALAGAELLALPVNWPAVARPAGEHPPETIQAMAAARSSRLATIIADRSGEERGVEWTAGTTIIDEDGWVAAEPRDGLAITTLTLRKTGDKSLPPHNDLFADRRPDLY